MTGLDHEVAGLQGYSSLPCRDSCHKNVEDEVKSLQACLPRALACPSFSSNQQLCDFPRKDTSTTTQGI